MIQKPEIQCDATTAQERGAEHVAKAHRQTIRVISKEKGFFFPRTCSSLRKAEAEKPKSRQEKSR